MASVFMSFRRCRWEMVTTPVPIPSASLGEKNAAWLVRWLIGLSVIAVLADVLLPSSVLAGDPKLYDLRAQNIFDGAWPYVEAEFEHLPLMLPVILLTRVISQTGMNPALVYLAVMAGVVAATSVLVHRTSHDLGVNDGLNRWLVAAGPLLPLVLFRLEPIPVLFTVLAIRSMAAGDSRRLLVFAGLGAAAKGWPAVFALPLWWQRQRGPALALVVFIGALVALLYRTPGFQSGREFEGVHTETLVGSVVLLQRNLGGSDLGIIEAAWSIYIEAPWWAPLLHVAVGGGIGVWALVTLLRQPYTHRLGLRLCGAATAAAMVASPLLSGQFIFWLAPFVALAAGRRTRLLYLALGLATTVLLAHWRLDQVWWSALALSRVVGVGLLAVMLVLEADESDNTGESEAGGAQRKERLRGDGLPDDVPATVRDRGHRAPTRRPAVSRT